MESREPAASGGGCLRLEADADAFAVLAGRPTSLARVVEATRAQREAGHEVRWEIPLLPTLVPRLEGLWSLARAEGAHPVLLPPQEALDAEARRFAWDFVHYRLLEEEAAALPEAERTACAGLARQLAAAAGAADDAPAAGAPAAAAPLLDVAGVLGDGVRALAQWTRAQLSVGAPGAGADTGTDTGTELSEVLLIGAYGGDHIGDAAILGGVLRRLRKRHGTARATLMSQRPGHTRRLVAMLETPVAVRVEAYEHARIRARLAEAEAVVFAGGPLTDIPKQLVRHLYAASLARRSGKPFWIEGVGVGPFPRPPSAFVGRRLARLAGRISVRTSDDARQPEVRDLHPEIGRDPAFDYLETRGPSLTKLPESDRRAVEALLAGTEGRPCVGVNTRPIGTLFTAGTPEAVDRAEHTRQVEARFEEALAAGLRRFDAACRPRPCFVFYPMNAIQFGQSDLRSAFRIQRHLGDAVDFRVWQGDPSIDGVLQLLRRLDGAIAMRFHGAIYALSQGLPVIGIDYRPGKRDKVAYLLGDLGREEDCTRIDTLEADWLAEKLLARIPRSAE